MAVIRRKRDCPARGGGDAKSKIKLKGRLRWYHVYFLFALLDMAIIVSSLSLQHMTLSSFGRLVSDVDVILREQIWVSSLRGSLFELNAPGNDVFKSHNVARERERFHVATGRFREILAGQDVKYADILRPFVAGVEEMITVEGKIFDALDPEGGAASDEKKAAEIMAVMDQIQSSAMSRLESLSNKLLEENKALLFAQQETLQGRRRAETRLALLMGLAILGVIYFGRRMHLVYEEYAAEQRRAAQELKQIQSHLVQSEKMASIGQLAAGVAHEINNPLGFIGNNMEILGQYIADYARVLGAAGKLEEAVAREDLAKAKSVAAEMARLKEEVNLDYITGDMSGLLSHTQNGIARIKTIVMDLRAFSHKDQDEDAAGPVKIEEVIESVLNIVHNELKYKAELKKDYGQTPLVKCDTRRMGQVFINLLVNAAQAIESRGTIAIRTYTREEHVCVDVTDTGKGIEEQDLIKIFDPFFTTKPVGVGTGLGLSVSYEIVKKYDGEIRVRSKVGAGTTFTVMMPIERRENLTIIPGSS